MAKIPMGQGGVDVCLTYEVDVAIDCDPSLCRCHHCRCHCGSCISCPSCQPRLEPQESVNATPNATVQEMHVHELELIDGILQRSCCRRCGCGYCASAAPGVFNPSRNKVTSCWTSAARRMRSSSDSCWSLAHAKATLTTTTRPRRLSMATTATAQQQGGPTRCARQQCGRRRRRRPARRRRRPPRRQDRGGRRRQRQRCCNNRAKTVSGPPALSAREGPQPAPVAPQPP